MSENSSIEKMGQETSAIQKMVQYRKKGIEIGMATDDGSPLDIPTILKAVNHFRELTKTGQPTLQENQVHVFDSPMAAYEYDNECTRGSAFNGNQDIQWLITALYLKVEEGNTQIPEAVMPLLELANHVGWFWMSDEKLVLTRRPKHLHFIRKQYDNAEELARDNRETSIMIGHRTDGPAIEFHDGRGVYMLNGIRLDSQHKWLVTEPERRTLKNILAISNVELRNEGLKLLPPDEFQKGANFEVIDEATIPNGGSYELRKFQLEGEPVARIYLKGCCPSKGEDFNEAVPPNITTVEQALLWREDEIDVSDAVNGSQYQPPVMRT